MTDRFLVTGSSGCLGAWTIRQLLDEAIEVVALDISDDDHRLRLVLSTEEIERLPTVRADIRDLTEIEAVLAGHRITHVIHLAALQVPFCAADPVRGAEVNVTGTTNLLEAARRTDGGVRGVAFASSAAVFGPPERYPHGRVTDDSPLAPTTLYGVYKQANEGTARRYAADYGLGSIGLRPCVVYGPGRDQGLTSDPTKAMLSVVAGQPAHIAFGGATTFQHAADAAACFVAAARAEREDASVVNMGGSSETTSAFVDAVEAVVPEAAGTLTHDDEPLPLPSDYDATGLDALIGARSYRSMTDGVADSVERFRRLMAEGLISPT